MIKLPQKTLTKMLPILGDRKAVIARELNKKFEEFYRGTLSELAALDEELKGELVLIVEGNGEPKPEVIDLSEINERIQAYIDSGISASQAIRQVAEESGINKHDLYNAYHNTGDVS